MSDSAGITQNNQSHDPARQGRRLRYITPQTAYSSGEVFRKGQRPKSWRAWVKHLAGRRSPTPPRLLVPNGENPLLWALPPDLWESDSVQFVSRLAKKNGSRRRASLGGEELAAWAVEADDRLPDAALSLESLALAHALPRLAGDISEDLWWELLDHCLAITDRASSLSAVGEPIAHQLAAGELPLTLRYEFPELSVCRGQRASATAAISTGIEELLDGEGLPHCSNLPALRSLLACWTRCGLLLQEMTGAALRSDARLQYEWLVRQALRLTRADGSHVLTNGAPPDCWSELFTAALEVGGDEEDRAIAQQVLPDWKPKKTQAADKLPPAAARSEWAETAVLRSDWSRTGPRLLVTYTGGSVATELECGGEVIFSGAWEQDIEVNGKPIGVSGDWEETCWFSDKDVDYLELQVKLEDGWRLQRHVMLARQDLLLLLADAVIGDDSAELSYRGRLPVTSEIGFDAEEDTWEGFLGGRQRRALVVPLALPEWRQGTRQGTLRLREVGLELAHKASAPALFAPLILDLDPRRFEQDVTWRQLTVAEQLNIQPPHVAAAYRLQRGKKNWLFYRSLAPQANRTVLGHNLCSELLCARFDRHGEVTPLIEIE